MKLPPEIHERMRHGKKAAKHKPYEIESRHLLLGMWRDWWVYSRYETREQRDQALPGLKRKYDSIRWEFRAKDPD